MTDQNAPKVNLTVISIGQEVIAKWYSSELRPDRERIAISQQIAAAHQTAVQQQNGGNNNERDHRNY